MKDDILDFTKGFTGDTIGPIPVADALRRVIAFGCSPRSGFLGYDLAGHVARETGRLTEISPWSILLADALAGQVTVENVSGFIKNMKGFATLIRAVPDRDLVSMTPRNLSHVIEFCTFGFPGAWAPKITKVGALFRPKAVPILDGYLALAFGYSRDTFSVGREPRWQAIARVTEALWMGITANSTTLAEVRHQAELRVPAIKFLSDVRLADVIIWTSQDDRMERRGKQRNAWLNAKPGEPTSINDIMWLPSTPLGE